MPTQRFLKLKEEKKQAILEAEMCIRDRYGYRWNRIQAGSE